RVAAANEHDGGGRRSGGHHVDEGPVTRDRQREPAHGPVVPDVGRPERHEMGGDHDVPETALGSIPVAQRGHVLTAGGPRHQIARRDGDRAASWRQEVQDAGDLPTPFTRRHPDPAGADAGGIDEVRRLLDVGSGSDPTGLQIPRPQHPSLRILRRVDQGAVQPRYRAAGRRRRRARGVRADEEERAGRHGGDETGGDPSSGSRSRASGTRSRRSGMHRRQVDAIPAFGGPGRAGSRVTRLRGRRRKQAGPALGAAARPCLPRPVAAETELVAHGRTSGGAYGRAPSPSTARSRILVPSARMGSGSSSKSGNTTNERSVIRGCGIVSTGSFTVSSSYSKTSMSIVRGPQRTSRVRPSSASTRLHAARTSCGPAWVSARITAFRYGGWSGGPPTGSVSQTRDETTARTPSAASRSTADWSDRRRSPRFAPRPS